MLDRKLKIGIILLLFSFIFIVYSCESKLSVPNAPPLQSIDPTYVQISEWKGGLSKGQQITFNQPQDVMVGREPLIYVADTGNNRIVALNEGGFVEGISKTIQNPVALTQDRNMNLIIVNGTHRVFKIDLKKWNHVLEDAIIDTVFEDDFGSSIQYIGVSAYTDLKKEEYNYYYVASRGIQTRHHQILKFAPRKSASGDSTLGQQIPFGPELGKVDSLTGITTFEYDKISSNKNIPDFIFVQTGGIYKVQWITKIIVPTEGEQFFSKLGDPVKNINVPSKFIQPEDITVDVDQNIYIVDAKKDSLLMFTKNGDVLVQKVGDKEFPLSFGGTGSGEKQFKNPNGVAYFVKNRSLFVADTGNNRILEFKLSTDLSAGQ